MRGLLLGVLVVAGCKQTAADLEPVHLADDAPGAAVAAVLDDFHQAAAAADEERYFAHFAPEGVFLGTDASERWTVEEFRAYAHPHFSKGDGWTYKPGERHIELSSDDTIAWFDEKLTHEKYGELRGTGVLRNLGGVWRIAQYNLTFVIPNDRVPAMLEALTD